MITKSDYISKSKNRTKKIHKIKMSVRSILICPQLKKIEFLGAQKNPFGRPNAIWKFTAIFILPYKYGSIF